MDAKKVMNEITSLQEQINTLNTLLIEKKQIMAKYFDKNGTREFTNDAGTLFIQERTATQFDINGMLKNLPKELTDEFITKTYTVKDWHKFAKFMKKQGIQGSDLKPYFNVTKEVDKEALSELYDHKEISLKELKPYMDIKFTKSLCLRLKKKEDD